MRFDAVEALLPVYWADGMVVARRHLAHTDNRLDHLISIVCRTVLDQPGIMPPVAPSSPGGPLISIAPCQEGADALRVPIRLERTFVGMVPSGELVVGHPGDRATRPPTVATRSRDLAGSDRLLLCVSPAEDDPQIVRRAVDDEQDEIELLVRPLHFELLAPTEYGELFKTDLPRSLPIGALDLSNGSVRVDRAYIPPLAKLSVVSLFDDGILSSLSSKLTELLVVVDDTIERVEKEFAASQGRLDWKLLSRRGNYEALRALLFATRGLASQLERLSPARLWQEVIVPLSFWWMRHQERHFPDVSRTATDSVETTLERLTKRAAGLSQLDHASFCKRTDEFLIASDEFLSCLGQTLRVCG